MSCEAISGVLFLDDDTIRTWHRLYQEEGIEGLAGFGHEGSACRLSDALQDKLKTWITATLPRTTREVGAWIETECGITYESRSGLIALLHRLGMEHRKPKAVSSKLDPDKQAAFIKAYENLLNQLADDEAVLFGDAVHPTHAVRPVGCWAPKDTPVAVEQTSGRQRLNIHGAIDPRAGTPGWPRPPCPARPSATRADRPDQAGWRGYRSGGCQAPSRPGRRPGICRRPAVPRGRRACGSAPATAARMRFQTASWRSP